MGGEGALRIITAKDQEALEVIRHSTAHLLAQAVQQLWPKAQVTIGPVIEDGFYYDFAIDHTFSVEDLARIEAKMRELIAADLVVTRTVVTRDEAVSFFRNLGEHYKVEIIEGIPGDEALTTYRQGEFVDLCRGPHVPRTGVLGAFKLTKVAGAYWRGDSKNPMLQRIYGVAFADQAALKAYLLRIEEAEKRDHRVLGKRMELFHVQPEAPGCIFWHPKGWQIMQTLRAYIRLRTAEQGYEEINTPQLVDSQLWEASGHKAKFSSNMFSSWIDEREYLLKPMNCPCHVQVFKQGLKSYRDLPIRLSEFGSCHRNEASGTLHGIMRLRAFVQDDAHIFCTEEQVPGELMGFMALIHQVYADFGFHDIVYKLSTRPENWSGQGEVWDRAEQALADALDAAGVTWEYQPGEGAFYGPKVEFTLRDCLGRSWQCGTVQVDYVMPERLGAYYVAEDGSRQHPVMLHRAMLGSMERFLGVLLEHHGGDLPLWLAPVQAVAFGVTDKQAPYVSEVVEEMRKSGLRVTSDLRNEKIGFKIREHTLAKIPYLLVVGDREVEARAVSVRRIGSEASTTVPLSTLIADLKAEVLSRR